MILSKVIKKVKIFLIMLVLLFSSLIIVNLIPKECIENNIKESVNVFQKEGAFPKVKYTYKYLLDNYTDALMLNTAYSVDTNEPIKSAILMRRNYRPNENLTLEKIDNENNTIKNLQETLNGENTTYYEYSRYWHGYMLALRPLLVFFNYMQIRIIYSAIIIMLSVVLIYITYKKIDLYTAIATLFILIVSNFYFIGLSIQYSSVFIIMLTFSIYIIQRYKQIKNIFNIFFIIGILTSFFDLLTTPLITLGIPIIYYIILENRENKYNIKILLKAMLWWGLGYILMWCSKWVLSDLLYNTGTISRALQKVTLLSNNTNEINISIKETFNINITYINATFIFTIVVCTIISCIARIKKIKQNIPYLIIAILPFIWFILVKNHSYIHARFTYRNLIITIFALIIIIMQNIRDYLSICQRSKT